MKLPCKTCGKIGPSWCPKANCPLFPKTTVPAKQSFAGTTPNLFVGSYGYPSVRLGILAAHEYTEHDNPKAWSESVKPISEIVSLRSALINSVQTRSIANPVARTEMNALIAQSASPVNVDIDLAKPPVFTVTYPTGTTPHGPSVELKRAQITQNVHVPTDVDKTLNDELTASEQVNQLSQKHDVYYLQKIFSAGLLGQEKKLVPTRWSITAVDDTLSKEHLTHIRTYPIISEIECYVGGHYGNYYCIIYLPAQFQYELFELWVGSTPMPTTVWTDYESFRGRTNYADQTVGGYYAARLRITEHLTMRKRQASVLAFRFVTDEYTNPLGVWVVREAVEKTLRNKPLRFASTELAITFLKHYSQHKHHTNVQNFISASKLLRALNQRTMFNF